MTTLSSQFIKRRKDIRISSFRFQVIRCLASACLKNRKFESLFVFFGLIVFFATPLQGQTSMTFQKCYFSVGLGGVGYLNGDIREGDMPLGYAGDVSFGINLFQTVGFRVQALGTHVRNITNLSHFYFGGHADVTFNLLKFLRGGKASVDNELQLFFGCGFIQRFVSADDSRDNELMLVPGVFYEHRIFNDVLLHLEIKSLLFPPDFDHNAHISSQLMFTAGILHRFSNHPYQATYATSHIESRKNWYFSVAAGANSFIYKGVPSTSSLLSQVGPTVDVAVGHYVSPVWGLRMSLSGGISSTHRSSFTTLAAHGDVLFNINNMIYPQQNRRFNMSVYAGAGLIGNFSNGNVEALVHVGVLPRIWLSLSSDIFFDARYMVMPARFTGLSSAGILSTGMLSAQIGYCYNFSVGTHR